MNYSFSVTGVDIAKRTGEKSDMTTIIMDGECIDYWVYAIYTRLITVPELVIDLNFTLIKLHNSNDKMES